MSTIEQTANGINSRIPIGRRISELLHERGDAYSIRAFAPRVGMNRETFRITLKGERPITLSTIEKIASSLGITEERLRQLDTKKKEDDLASFLNANQRNRVMLLRAQLIANELVESAIGATERGISLNNLGRVQYLLKDFDEAHETWLRAYEYAKHIREEYNDKHLLHLVSGNLLLTFTIRREYSNIERLLETIEHAFPDDPKAQGTVFFTRMRLAEDRGNVQQAKDYACRSLEQFKQTQDDKQIGHGLINLAHCEYKLGIYEASSLLLSDAIKILQCFEPILILAVKEYVKSLMQLQEYQSAIKVIEEYSALAKEYPDYWGKLQIMYSRATNNPAHADIITNNKNVGQKVRYYACKSLMEYYTSIRDFESVVRYYELSRIFMKSKSEYLNEGDF